MWYRRLECTVPRGKNWTWGKEKINEIRMKKKEERRNNLDGETEDEGDE